MVGGLLTGFDLAKSHARVLGGVVKHLFKIGLGHKMRAGAGGKITAAGKELHCLEVDLLVAANGVFQRVTALVKAGGSRMIKS